MPQPSGCWRAWMESAFSASTSERWARDRTALRNPKSRHIYAPHYTGGRGARHVFDVGLQEMVLIAVIVILFVPADEIPDLMRTLGRYYAKIRRASDDLRRAFNAEVARVDSE